MEMFHSQACEIDPYHCESRTRTYYIEYLMLLLRKPFQISRVYPTEKSLLKTRSREGVVSM